MANGPFSTVSLELEPEPLIVRLCPCRSVSAGCEAEDRAGGLVLGSKWPNGESRHPETGEAPKNLPWRMNAFTQPEQMRGIDEEYLHFLVWVSYSVFRLRGKTNTGCKAGHKCGHRRVIMMITHSGCFNCYLNFTPGTDMILWSHRGHTQISEH